MGLRRIIGEMAETTEDEMTEQQAADDVIKAATVLNEAIHKAVDHGLDVCAEILPWRKMHAQGAQIVVSVKKTLGGP